MPVTYPVAEQIRQEIVDRLETLLVEDTEQTFAIEVIEPERLGNYSPKDLQFVVTQDEAEKVPELCYPGNPPAVCWRQVYTINCNVIPSETDDTPYAQHVNQIAADAIKVICTPETTWHTFDGLSVDAEFDGQRPAESGIVLSLIVTYRHDENDPYTVRA